MAAFPLLTLFLQLPFDICEIHKMMTTEDRNEIKVFGNEYINEIDRKANEYVERHWFNEAIEVRIKLDAAFKAGYVAKNSNK